MTQDFTTPEFADLLKEHGIEVDTPFVILMCHEGHYKVALKDSTNKGCLDFDGCSYWIDDFSDVKPAYLLTQVLRWLPLEIETEYDFYYLNADVYAGLDLRWGYETLGEKGEQTELARCTSIEQLITQGLKEGWLNKDNLNL